MPKPDAALLDPARYPFSCTIETRFGDLDVNLHVNNVALMGLCEEGRVRFHHASGYNRHHGEASAMIASFSIDFLGEAFHPELIDAHAACSSVGRTSHIVDQLLTQAGRTVALARSVIVNVRDGRPIEVPPGFRESVKAWMLRG